MATNPQSQLERVERLQELWLKEMINRLEGGEATSQDLATLSRFLMLQGWNLDPSKIPESLKSKLTSPVPADELDDAIIPIRRTGS